MKIAVTGASRGLGRALCEEALARGWQVIALCRRIPEDKIPSDGQSLEYGILDLENPDSIIAAADRIVSENEVLDGLINNAGLVAGRENTLETLNLDDLRRCMQVNVYGPMELTRRLLPLLRKSTSAGIVNITSAAGALKGPRETDYPYAMSKCALNMFSEKLRVYTERDSIRVAAVHPGWMRTALGSPNAPVDPRESAANILDILCGARKIEADPAYVDRFGKPILSRADN